MKKLLTLVALIFVVTTASAQLKFGVKGGMNITAMSFNHKAVSADNRTGFYIGPTMKLIAPGSGLGFDVSILYDQRQLRWDDDDVHSENFGQGKNFKQQQLTIPINLRWEWNAEVVGIFVYVGPELDMNVGGNYDEEYWRWHTTRWSANVGAGIMFVNHLQLNFNYNFACNRGGGFYGGGYEGTRGSFNAWQLGIAVYI